MHAMVLNALGGALQWTELPDRLPGPGEIRIKVSACGVCRTDLHVIDGELANPQLPIIPGHEVVGRVDAIGPGVDTLSLGARVGLPWLGHTCGVCPFCLAHRENLCDHPVFTGYTQVVVQDGWLTLSGELEWEYQRQAAFNALRDLTGVKGLSNNIVLKPKVSVSSVKSDIEAALKRRAIADAATIRVEVKGADVTLSGTVKSWPERELAHYSAWSTAGVQDVVNHIVVSY